MISSHVSRHFSLFLSLHLRFVFSSSALNSSLSGSPRCPKPTQLITLLSCSPTPCLMSLLLCCRSFSLLSFFVLCDVLYFSLPFLPYLPLSLLFLFLFLARSLCMSHSLFPSSPSRSCRLSGKQGRSYPPCHPKRIRFATASLARSVEHCCLSLTCPLPLFANNISVIMITVAKEPSLLQYCRCNVSNSCPRLLHNRDCHA